MARKRNQSKRGKSKGGSTSYGSSSSSSRQKSNNNKDSSLINNVINLINVNNNSLSKWINNSNSLIYVGIFSIVLLTVGAYFQPQSTKILLYRLGNNDYVDMFNPFSNHHYVDGSLPSHLNADINNYGHNPSSSNIHTQSQRPHVSSHLHGNNNNGGNHQFCRIQSTPTPNFQRQLENENKGYIEFQGCRIVPSSEHISSLVYINV